MRPLQPEAVRSLDAERHRRLPDIVQRERASKKRRNGPIAQDALLSFALPSSSAERPSTSRRFTSLPSVAATMRPADDAASTTSGSGLFHDEFGWMPASIPVPTAAIGCALVKISASGPMPTSRYWLHAPCSISTCFRCAASADPGLQLRQVVAHQPVHLRADRRGGIQVAARAFLDHPLDHRYDERHAGRLDRLQVDRRQQPWPAGVALSGGVLASTSSSLPMRSPLAARRRAAGSRGLAQIAHGREVRGYIQQITVAYGDDGRTAGVRPPHPSRQRGLRGRRPAALAATRREVRPCCVLPNSDAAPYTMHHHEPGGRPMGCSARRTPRTRRRFPSRTPMRSGARSCLPRDTRCCANTARSAPAPAR